MSRVGGNSVLYMKLLRQFIEQHALTVEQVTDALAKGDTALAERLAHTLKGVAGNIGSAQVPSAAGALEKAIRDRAPATNVDAAQQRLAAVLHPLVAHLQAVLPSVTDSPAPPTSAPSSPAQSREAGAE